MEKSIDVMKGLSAASLPEGAATHLCSMTQLMLNEG